jgi:hypothetical protein
VADDRVLMHHPQLPEGPSNPQLVSRRAWEKVWRFRGWKLVPRIRKKESSK